MAWKDVILERLSWMRQALERRDLPADAVDTSAGMAESPLAPGADVAAASVVAPRRSRVTSVGPYAPLIAAIRTELERFIATDVRLHLSIAAHDRFLLRAIELACDEGDIAASVLRRFREEFKPEQIKRFLAREVIGGLPNAAAIDLSQFEGLRSAEQGGTPGAEDTPYAELIAALNDGTDAGQDTSAYTVVLDGRWYEADTAVAAMPDSAVGSTPLASDVSVRLRIEDRDGARELILPAAMPGRRYSLGKDPYSDVALDGTYASRRHCELWLENGRWRIEDLGSTNGTRVELAGRILGVSGGAHAGKEGRSAIVEVPPAATIVLSARARGEAADYPRVTLEARCTGAEAAKTPLAPVTPTPKTAITPVGRALPGETRYMVEARTAEGVRSAAIDPSRLPWSAGRSRRSAMTLPRAHEGVSGRHIDIVTLDEHGAEVLVLGDNGVRIGDVAYGPGERFHWRSGEVLELGRAHPDEPLLTMTLTRDGADAE